MEFFDNEVIMNEICVCTCDDQSCVSSGCDPVSCDN